MRRPTFAYLATAGAVIAQCTPSQDPQPTDLANPAATFCLDQDGTYDIRDNADGQVGICVLPDGAEVDAWSYYRENTQ